MPTPVKLLLIDDQPSFVRGLTRLLQRDGYTVETAANGYEALAQFPTHHYDVIVCDLQMPALDGHAFYDRLRRQFPSLCQRVIFVTGDTLGIESAAFLAQCGRPCLYKPCTAAAVREAIQQQLGRATSAAPGAPGKRGRDRGASMPEEGTLSLVRRGAGYHVRYASNHPYAPEYPARVCPDEPALRTLLHTLGTDAAALQHACAVARTGRMVVLHLLITPEQREAYFGPITPSRRDAPWSPQETRRDAVLLPW
jgi:CheY-like chemotaxis protein